MPRSRARRGLVLAVAVMAFLPTSAAADLVGSPDLSATPDTSGPCGQTPSCVVIQTSAPDGVALTSNRTSSTLARIDLKKGAQALTIKPAVARKNANGSFTIVSIGAEITFPTTAGEHSAAISPPLTIAYGEYPAIFYPNGGPGPAENADVATYGAGSGYGITYFTNVTGPGDYSRNFMLRADPVAGPSTSLAGYHFRMRFFIPSEKDGQPIPTGPPSTDPPPGDGDDDPPGQGDGGGDPTPVPDLSVGFQDDVPNTAMVGDSIEYEVTVRNVSAVGADATELHVTGVSPGGDAGSLGSSARPFGWNPQPQGTGPYNLAGGLTWSIPPLGPGEEHLVKFGFGWASLEAYFADSPLTGDLRAKARIGITDANLANNESSAVTRMGVLARSKPTCGKSKSSAGVSAGCQFPEGSRPSFSGTASGRASRVEIAILKPGKGAKPAAASCLWLKNKRGKLKKVKPEEGKCRRPVWLEAKGAKSWTFSLTRALSPGKYVLYSRARTSDDGFEQAVKRNRLDFTIR